MSISASMGPGGLPVRPGEQDCAYFMRMGQCKYGERCKWHHPPDRQTPSGGGRSGMKLADEPADEPATMRPDEGTESAELQLQQRRTMTDLCVRIRDLAESDPLLRRDLPAVSEAGANSREGFNQHVTTQLLRIAERACVRSSRDCKAYKEEVLDIIREMYKARKTESGLEWRLMSQAFACCLETHCIKRMGKFDSDAWAVKAERLLCSSFFDTAEEDVSDMDLGTPSTPTSTNKAMHDEYVKMMAILNGK